MNKTVALFLAALLLLATTARPAFAQLDGISEVGHSYQSDARGGCEVAIGDTALAHVRQPASVMLQPKARFDSKISNIFPINDWNDHEGAPKSTIQQLLSYNLGAVVPINKKVSAGIAWETGGWNTHFNNRSAPAPNLSTASFALKKDSIYANIGTRLTDKWLIGGGPHLEIMSFGTKIPLGPGLLDWPSSTSVGGGYQLGTLYALTKKVQLGASYSSPSYMGALTSGNAKFSVPGQPNLAAPIRLGANTLPGRVSFGVSHSPTEKLKLASEAGYLNYGDSVFGRARINGLFNSHFDSGFKNLWVINTGADYDFSRHVSGSVGYVFNTSPVNRAQMIPFYISNAQNMFTWGLRYKRDRWWTGFAHIIGLPATSNSTADTHLGLGSVYQISTVHQMLQSFNCGVGFSF